MMEAAMRTVVKVAAVAAEQAVPMIAATRIK
jgi:hypothetical protein